MIYITHIGSSEYNLFFVFYTLTQLSKTNTYLNKVVKLSHIFLIWKSRFFFKCPLIYKVNKGLQKGKGKYNDLELFFIAPAEEFLKVC